MADLFFEIGVDKAGNLEISGTLNNKSFRGLVHPEALSMVLEGLIAGLAGHISLGGKILGKTLAAVAAKKAA